MREIIAFLMKVVYAAGACVYLCTVGFLFSRNRPLISRICVHFGYPRRWRIPEVDIELVAPDTVSVEIHRTTGIYGNISLLESVVLARLAKLRNARNIFEIGTFNGRSTLNLAANSAPDARVVTLDLPRESARTTRLPLAPVERMFIEKDMRIGELFKGTEHERKIVQEYGDSASFDFGPYRNTMDMVFVDGSHSSEYVLNDSRLALKLLRDGKGLIVWHDYGAEGGWDGVIRVLNRLHAEGGVFSNLMHVKHTTFVVLTID